MWTGVATFFAGLFSSTKMQDTAVDAVRKLGGLDEMSSREKAQFLLDYMAATKYQSPMRRLIALLLTVVYVGIICVWLVSAGVGYYGGSIAALEMAGAVKMFMESVLLTPFNLVLSFYFVTNIAQKVGK
jgi:magnesium-transporting ATPase (P-type)